MKLVPNYSGLYTWLLPVRRLHSHQNGQAWVGITRHSLSGTNSSSTEKSGMGILQSLSVGYHNVAATRICAKWSGPGSSSAEHQSVTLGTACSSFPQPPASSSETQGLGPGASELFSSKYSREGTLRQIGVECVPCGGLPGVGRVGRGQARESTSWMEPRNLHCESILP